MTPSTVIAAILLGFTASPSAGAGMAQAARPADPDEAIVEAAAAADLDSIVRRLDDESLEVRRRASRELLEFVETGGSCEHLLERRDLSPESRQRILGVLRRHIIEGPKGAMGIRHRHHPSQGGEPAYVQIENLIDGLPARKVFEIGDRILSIDGTDLSDDSSLQQIVQTKRPGQTIECVVMRPQRDDDGSLLRDESNEVLEERIIVRMRLGSADRLPNGPPPATLEQATEARRLRWRRIMDRYGESPQRVRIADTLEGRWFMDPANR